VDLVRCYVAHAVLLEIKDTKTSKSTTGLLHIDQKIRVALLTRHTVGDLAMPVTEIVRYASRMKFLGLVIEFVAQ
jgi:hypothetical protein